MAEKSTAVFTECVNRVSPLKKPGGIFSPIEEKIFVFFDRLKKNERVNVDEIEATQKMLDAAVTDLVNDALFLQQELDGIRDEAKRLRKYLTAVEYFTNYPFVPGLEAYLRLDRVNRENRENPIIPTVFAVAEESPEKSEESAPHASPTLKT